MNQTITSLSSVVEVIRVLNEEVGRNDIGSQTILTFLAVAQAGTIPQSQLEKLTGLTGAGVSRNVARLSSIGSREGSGMDLIVSYEDPMDRRHKLIALSQRGMKVLATILNRLAGNVV